MTCSRRHRVITAADLRDASGTLFRSFDTAICDECGARILVGRVLRISKPPAPPAPPAPGSSPLTYLAIAVFVAVVGLVGGWALWEWAVSK